MVVQADQLAGDPRGETTELHYGLRRALTDTYLVETMDGPHVTFGRGRPCPDDVVVGLLVSDERPTAETTCTNLPGAPFIGSASPSSTTNALEYRAQALDLEVYAHPDYTAWDGGIPLILGCRFGGTVRVTAADADAGPEHRLEMDACAVLQGEPMTGTGVYRGPEEGRARGAVPQRRADLPDRRSCALHDGRGRVGRLEWDAARPRDEGSR